MIPTSIICIIYHIVFKLYDESNIHQQCYIHYTISLLQGARCGRNSSGNVFAATDEILRMNKLFLDRILNRAIDLALQMLTA